MTRAPEISIDMTPAGGRVHINGVLCRAVKAVVAFPGADIMLMLDRQAVRVNRGECAASDQDLAPGPLATDGQA